MSSPKLTIKRRKASIALAVVFFLFAIVSPNREALLQSPPSNGVPAAAVPAAMAQISSLNTDRGRWLASPASKDRGQQDNEWRAILDSANQLANNDTLMISRFRENGPAGAGDEFVEIYNPSCSMHTVTSSNGSGYGVFFSAGNGTTSNAVSLACHIPEGTVIPASGYFLCVGASYSLRDLGRNGGVAGATAGGDAAIIADIPNDAGLALVNTSTFPIFETLVFDKVGFAAYGPSAPAPASPSIRSFFCEGICLQPVGDASLSDSCNNPSGLFPVIAAGSACYGQSGQYELLRRQTTFDPNVGTVHQDTASNGEDFILVSPNPAGNAGRTMTGISGATSVLGAAGPQGLAAPPDSPLSSLMRAPFDVGSQLGPRNSERRFNVDPSIANPANDPLGTFALRFRFTNNSGSNITGLRFRVDNVSTLCGPQTSTPTVGTGEARNVSPSTDCGANSLTAILKLLNSPSEFVGDSQGGVQLVHGTVIEDLSSASSTPPGPLSPLGGGVDNSIIVGHADNGGIVGDGVTGGRGNFGITMGTSGPTNVLRVQIKFGVVRNGRFTLLITPMAKFSPPRRCCPTITINPAALVPQTWAVHEDYPAINLTATGGSGPHAFTVSGGTLPPGMMVDPNGTLHGEPFAPGTYNFTVTGTDANGCRGVRDYRIMVINCPLITLNPAAAVLPAAVVNSPYSQTFTSTGGCSSSFTYSLTGGILPTGLTLGTNGTLSGTVTQLGDFVFALRATDSCGCSTVRTYRLKVDCPTGPLPLFNTGTVSGGVLPNGTADPHYTLTLPGGSAGTAQASAPLSPSWLLNSAASKWIVPSPATTAPGQYIYRTTFDLAECDLSSVVITGRWSSDNNGFIRVNGGTTQLFPTPFAGFGAFTLFTLDSSNSTFVAGTNMLEFVVNNQSNVTGVRVEMKGTVKCCGPTCTPKLCNQPFMQAVNFPVASRPQYMASADLNGDGNLDVVVPNSGSGNVSVLLGNGQGALSAATNFAVGTNPQAVAVGDFNGDGKLDLAVANQDTSNISILLGNGTGNFGAAVNFNTGGSPLSIAAGDFNGDNKLDLAVSNNVGVRVMFGDGFGAFSSGPLLIGGVNSRGIALADLTFDDNPDIVVANLGSGTVSVWLSNVNGTFLGPSTFNVGSAPFFVAISDLDADGRVDLAVANGNSRDVSVLVGNSNGNVNFDEAINFPTGQGAQSLAVSDFNGDGKKDLVVGTTEGSNVSVLVGKGDGTFGSATTFVGGLNPVSVVAGDFNSDGRPDIATSNFGSNNVSLFLNACPVAPSGPITINPATLPKGTRGVAYNQSLTAIGGAAPYTFSVLGGSLPPGLTLSSVGSLSGTPTEQGTFIVVIKGTDVNGCAGVHSYELEIECQDIVINPISLLAGRVGTAYSQTLTATGGCTPQSFSVLAGALPPGLTLSPNGILSGTPTGLGNFVFVVRVINSCGCNGRHFYLLRIRRAFPGTISGRVIDPQNRPIQGTLVQIPGRAPVTTNVNGTFTIDNLPEAERLAISFSATGFVNTTRVFPVRPISLGITDTVLLPRTSAVVLNATNGGRVTFAQGGGLTIPPNALVDSDGNLLTGDVRVSLTYLDVSDPNQIRTAPGDFTAQMLDNSVQTLESYGIFEVAIEDLSGGRGDLAPGKTATLALPIPRSILGKVPGTTRLFSFDTTIGRWMEAGTLILADDGLTYNGTIDRVDWSWNADDVVNTTCIRVKVFEPDFPTQGLPAANSFVTATGVDYLTVSSGYTDANGLVCLLVKRNSQVSLQARSTTNPTHQSVPIVITSPNTTSGAADCGDVTKCPLVQEIVLDIIVGSDLYIGDTPLDSGLERNLDTGPMWTSEDIWVRNEPDPGYQPYPFDPASPTWTPLEHQAPEYRDPKFSRPNYVYVRVRNRGTSESSGTERLRVYWAKASTGLGWPDQWGGAGVDFMANNCPGKPRLYGTELTKPRKNAAMATDAERNAYRDAILNIAQFVTPNWGLSYWHKQQQVHAQGPMYRHASPAFLPWHREYVNRYEALLQESDPTVKLLYWDWTKDPENSPCPQSASCPSGSFNFFSPTFMGSSGRNSNSLVSIGPPFNPPTGTTLAPPSVMRRLSSNTTPPSDPDSTLLAKSEYGPYAASLGGFAWDLEKMPNHNSTHGYIGGGGDMSSTATAAQDPFFFLLHANVDRLWAQWQRDISKPARVDPATAFHPLSDNINITTVMGPWDGSGTSIEPWTTNGGYKLGKLPTEPSVVSPPIYDCAPLVIPVLQPGEAVVMQIPWYPPNPENFDCFGGDQGHFCLLGRIETIKTFNPATDQCKPFPEPYGMTIPEGTDITANTRNNNNIAWKNVTVVDNFAGALRQASVLVRNIFNERVPTGLRFDTVGDASLFENGHVFVDLTPELLKRWVERGAKGSGIRFDPGNPRIEIASPQAFIQDIPLEAGEVFSVDVRFELGKDYRKSPTALAKFDLVQIGKPGDENAILGGQRFALDVSKLVLIKGGDDWRYLDDGTNPGPNWRSPDFDDATWRLGRAELGFGDDPMTTVDGGPSDNRNITTYFRRAFDVADPAFFDKLTLRLKRDDGAVVYLNGVEIHRVNLPAGIVGPSTFATREVAGLEEEVFFPITVDPGMLTRGANVVAVEVHQNSLKSPDLTFNLEFLANPTFKGFAPDVAFASLMNGEMFQKGEPVPIKVEAIDSDGSVKSVSLFADGELIFRSNGSRFTFIWRGASLGTHRLRAVALDRDDQTGMSDLTVTVVENVPPTVRLEQPSDGAIFQVGEVISAAAQAKDRLGAINRVEFYVRDGDLFAGEDQLVGSAKAPPFAVSIKGLAPGHYMLSALAWDNGGASSPSIPIHFEVRGAQSIHSH